MDERKREGAGGGCSLADRREARSNEKSLLVLPPHSPTAEGIDVSAEAFCFLRALLSPLSFTLTHGAQTHLRTFSLARLCFFSFIFLPFMNDSLSQYYYFQDVHGHLAVLVCTTSPQHISSQVQTPPGLSLQLQTHLGKISLDEERLDTLCSSSQ